MKSKMPTNKLAQESSPYLLQHQHNPVDWQPWSQEALNLAQSQNKPIIISIGYSSCHWCHVMEKESFEDESVGELMNQHFINIKVDREERPDIDNLYMEAVQRMGLNGGWPLNVFLMPDGRPFYGGTYFPKEQWMHLLGEISQAYAGNRDKLSASADAFTEALQSSEIDRYGLNKESNLLNLNDIALAFKRLAGQFDNERGGMNKAPKFPMPAIWQNCIDSPLLSQDEALRNQSYLTLDKMARGGIYDQVGGGFARYSVDAAWFAPHFEKMLYDNAQLIKLYSSAYQRTKNTRYKSVIEESIAFLDRELNNKEGGYYAALDADSEGIEGKFYCYTWEEFANVSKQHTIVLAQYFQVNNQGNWEEAMNILFPQQSIADFCKEQNVKEDYFRSILADFKTDALKERDNRVRPGLDNKSITSWNALLLTGLSKAYQALGRDEDKNRATALCKFIHTKSTQEGQLYRTYVNGVAKNKATLEDYATVIQAYIAYYQISFEEQWLMEATQLADHCIECFYDESDNFFYFTSKQGEQLIARKKELFDNVIPSSNSIMCENLYLLGRYFREKDYATIAKTMMAKSAKLISSDLQYTSQWGSVAHWYAIDEMEVVISGPEADTYRKELQQQHLPYLIWAGNTSTSSELELLNGRLNNSDTTQIYVCKNKSCKLPVASVDEALQLIHNEV